MRLYLPPGVQEKERVQSDYILKVGPGYPIPLPAEAEEPWKNERENQVCALQTRATAFKNL